MNEQEQDLIKKARAEYMRKWRKANPDKTSAINQRYWLRKSIEGLKETQAE